VLFSVLFSAGVDDRLYEVNNNHYYPSYFKKIEHPLLNLASQYDPWTHDAKLNFRLTVPVLLHIVHWPIEQRWILPVLTAIAICGIIFVSCIFTTRVTGDRVCGLYTALGVSCTYMGSFGFTMYYDAIALAQLTLAMLPGLHWFFRAVLVFSAAFTDERAFIAAPILLVQSLYSTDPNAPLRPRFFRADSLAVVGGMAAYCVGRALLVKFAGLSSPMAGTGFGNLLANLPYYHAGIWLALKGAWLLIFVASVALWQRREVFLLLFFLGTAGISIMGGLCVEDVIRSTSYVFPALLVAIFLISRRDTTYALRCYCLTAFVISAVAGNYNIWRSEISWFQPVAVKIIHAGLQFLLSPFVTK
jgi:hypothetical protein